MIDTVSTAGSSTGASRAVNAPGGALGKDEFLKLFLTQMKNQDPMNPMNGEQFAAQMAQFSSVEQLTNIAKLLETQASFSSEMLGAIGSNSAVGMLGKTITALGDHVIVSPDGTGTAVADVQGSGASATLRILDENGNEVGSRELGTLSPGRHRIELGDAASGLPGGTYRYEVDVTDASGAKVNVTTYTVARVDGLRTGANGPVLVAGDLEIPFAAITEVSTRS